MGVSFTIAKTKEFEESIRKFKENIVEEFLDDWADAVLFEAKRLLREGRIEGSRDPIGGAFDRGNLYKESTVIRTSEDERKVVFTALHAVFVEYGTPPHMPPVKPLQQWAKRNKFSNWKSAGWAIAMNIKKHGLPPRPFLRQASLTVEKRLQEIWDGVAKKYSS